MSSTRDEMDDDDDEMVIRECIGHSPYGPVYRGEVNGSSVGVLTLQSLLHNFGITPLSAEGRRFSEHLSEPYFSRCELTADSNLLLFPMGIQWPDDSKEDNDTPAALTEAFLAGERLYEQPGDSTFQHLPNTTDFASTSTTRQGSCVAVPSSSTSSEVIWSQQLDECDLVDIANDIAGAVSSLHSRDLVHGNICSGLLAIRRHQKHTRARLCYCCVPEAAHSANLSSGTGLGLSALIGRTSAPERSNAPAKSFHASEDVYAFGATMLELSLGRPIDGVENDLKNLPQQHPLYNVISTCTMSQPQHRPKMSSVQKSCKSLRLHNSYISAWSPEVGEYIRKLEEDQCGLEAEVEVYQVQLKRCNSLLEGLMQEEAELQKRVTTLQEEFGEVNAEHKQVLTMVEDWKVQRQVTSAPDNHSSNGHTDHPREVEGKPAAAVSNGDAAAATAAAAAAALSNGDAAATAAAALSNGDAATATVAVSNGAESPHSSQNGRAAVKEHDNESALSPSTPQRANTMPSGNRDGMMLPEINGDAQWRQNNNQLDGNSKYNSLKRRKRSSTVDSTNSPSRASPRKRLSNIVSDDITVHRRAQAVAARADYNAITGAVMEEPSPATNPVSNGVTKKGEQGGTSKHTAISQQDSSTSLECFTPDRPQSSREWKTEAVLDPASAGENLVVGAQEMGSPDSKREQASGAIEPASNGVSVAQVIDEPCVVLSVPAVSMPVTPSALADGITNMNSRDRRGSNLRRSASHRVRTPHKDSEHEKHCRQQSVSPVRTRLSPSLRDKKPAAGSVQRITELFRTRAQSGSEGSSNAAVESRQHEISNVDGIRRRSMSFTHLSRQPDESDSNLKLSGHKRAARAKSMIPSAKSSQDIVSAGMATSPPERSRAQAKKRIASLSERVDAAREKGIADDTWWMIRK